MLLLLRPSSEHILIVRAPGAKDQHGCHSALLSCAFREQEDGQAVPHPSMPRAVLSCDCLAVMLTREVGFVVL